MNGRQMKSMAKLLGSKPAIQSTSTTTKRKKPGLVLWSTHAHTCCAACGLFWSVYYLSRGCCDLVARMAWMCCALLHSVATEPRACYVLLGMHSALQTASAVSRPSPFWKEARLRLVSTTYQPTIPIPPLTNHPWPGPATPS